MTGERRSTDPPVDTERAERSPTSTMYPEGRWRYRAETARWNPFVRSLRGARVLSALLLPPWLVRTPRGYGVLQTMGRKTGRLRRKSVRVVRAGDVAYLVSIAGGDAAWVKNIRVHPQVRIRLGGAWFDGTAGESLNSTDLTAARVAYCRTVTPFDYLTCAMHRRGRPTRDKIRELTTAWFDGGMPLAIRLVPEPPRR